MRVALRVWNLHRSTGWKIVGRAVCLSITAFARHWPDDLRNLHNLSLGRPRASGDKDPKERVHKFATALHILARYSRIGK